MWDRKATACHTTRPHLRTPSIRHTSHHMKHVHFGFGECLGVGLLSFTVILAVGVGRTLWVNA
jgi:hypothetical protein